MKKISAVFLVIIMISICSCGNKKEDYSKKYKLMNEAIVSEIESSYVDFNSGWCKFSSEALRGANNRCGEVYKDLSSFSEIVITSGEVGGSNPDSAPYRYVAHGYIIGSDTYGREVVFDCNIIIHCLVDSGEIVSGGLEIDH